MLISKALYTKNIFTKIIALGIILTANTVLTGCSSGLAMKNSLEKYSEVYFDYFDTVTNVIGYEESEEAFLEKCTYVESELKRLDGLYDNYNSLPSGGVNLYYINAHAGEGPVEVDPDVIALFKEGKRIYEVTDGKTNFAFGAVLEIWHNYREEALNDPAGGKVPSLEELTEASKHCNIDDVVIDEENSTVFYKDPLLKCDVGAIAKGYALERISEGLRDMGAVNYTINAGGNVRSIGPKPDGGSWTVAIQNPDTEAEVNYVEVLDITDMALTTSGSYQRFYTVDGIRY
ncbi:MAG: FAD:protein FMN transferase, partial [Lachnospiraceae bacterium]|nr:FAD:protein FMN transferase [Lachnospiraceae bacterium]